MPLSTSSPLARNALVGVTVVGALAVSVLLLRPVPTPDAQEAKFATRPSTPDKQVDTFDQTSAGPSAWALFAPGEAAFLDVDYRSENTTVVDLLGGFGDARAEETQGVSAALVLDVELRVRAFWRGAGALGLGFEITKCRDATLTFRDQPLVEGKDDCEARFLGRELLADIDAEGRLLAIYPSAPDLAAQTLRVLAAELQLVLKKRGARLAAGASVFDTLDTTPLGTVASETTVAGSAVTRRRAGYQSLIAVQALGRSAALSGKGLLRAKLGSAGRLQHVLSHDRIVATSERDAREVVSAKTVFRARVSRHERAPLQGSTSGRQGFALTEVFTSSDVEMRLAEDQAGGLTRRQARVMLKNSLVGGELPNHRRSLWQLQGVLKLEPGLIDDIETLFGAEVTTTRGRGLLLDILVSSGTPRAQQALRQALSSPAAKKDRGYAMLYQRLSLVEEPDGKSLSFAREHFDRATSLAENDRLLAAYTLGSVLGKVDAPDRPAADDANAELQSMLGRAALGSSRAHLVKALSNARRAENQAIIFPLAKDEDSQVRVAVARAMRRPASRQGLEVLLELTHDSVLAVQTEAIRSLRFHELASADLHQLERLVRAGAVHRRNERELLNVLKHGGKADLALAAQVLETLAATSQNGEVIAASRQLAKSLVR